MIRNKFFILIIISMSFCKIESSYFTKCYIDVNQEELGIYNKAGVEALPFGIELSGIPTKYHVFDVIYKEEVQVYKKEDYILGIDDCTVLDLENSLQEIRKKRPRKFPDGKIPKIDYLAIFPEKFNEKFQSLTLIRNGKKIVIKRYEDRNIQ